MARILIADDNPVTHRLQIYILQLDNHEVVVASDGLQARELMTFTASGQGEDEAIAMEQRVSLFLTKPSGSRDLRSQISGLLGD